MKGYKAFDKDLKCHDMQYEIGKEYTFDGEPILCEQGFHFCESVANCYRFYEMSEDTRICEVSATGEIKTDNDMKYCTNKIKIIREIKNPRNKSNSSKTSSGYCNSGDYNSGNWNSGYCNSGDWNSGNWNSGYCNSGNWNSGNWNSGNWNSGNWNSGNWNSGLFNTERNPKIKIFDVESDWTVEDWRKSYARIVMESFPKTVIVTTEDKQKWWDGLPKEDKQAIYDLPNFDGGKFTLCTGIVVDR